MSNAIPGWVQVVAWLLPVVLTLIGAGLSAAGNPRPRLARGFYIVAAALGVVAVEISAVGVADHVGLDRWRACLSALLILSIAVNAWLWLTTASQRVDLVQLRDRLNEAERQNKALEFRSRFR